MQLARPNRIRDLRHNRLKRPPSPNRMKTLNTHTPDANPRQHQSERCKTKRTPAARHVNKLAPLRGPETN
jgi:hypothetical protein